jgi:hypothetical protein
VKSGLIALGAALVLGAVVPAASAHPTTDAQVKAIVTTSVKILNTEKIKNAWTDLLVQKAKLTATPATTPTVKVGRALALQALANLVKAAQLQSKAADAIKAGSLDAAQSYLDQEGQYLTPGLKLLRQAVKTLGIPVAVLPKH